MNSAGHQITDYDLYHSGGDIPVYTGNNEIKGFWGKSIVEPKNLPCISYPTKANKGVAYLQNDVFDANNTAILIPKENWREKIFLEWFLYKLPPIFLQIMTGKEGVSYLNKKLVEEIEIMIPKKEKQKEEVELLKHIMSFEEKLSSILEKIEVLLTKEFLP